nr:MAG TPA: hypothetical protein [Caudoviricetes sp.]
MAFFFPNKSGIADTGAGREAEHTANVPAKHCLRNVLLEFSIVILKPV